MRRTLFFIFMALTSITVSAQSEWDNYKPTNNQYVQLTQTNLPIVFIDLQGQRLAGRWEDRYIAARMKIIHNGEGNLNYGDTLAHPDQTVDYEGWIAIKYRGNSSFSNSDKKPYAFRTLESNVLPDDGGKKEKVKILGMGKDNKWAVIAPFSDKVMFRDILSFDLARPWMDFVPQARLCEFIIDGTYYGVYAIAERVSAGKQRLNLHDPGDDGGDLSGDYLVEIDRPDDPYYASQYRPWTDFNGTLNYGKKIYYQYKSPEEEDFAELPEGTREALHAEIHNMETSFAKDNFADPETGYRQYIDVTSFIDYMLATEVSMNIDGYRLSTNMYKYSKTRAQNEGLDSRWKMSLWDFNIAWGNANYYDGEKTNRWQYAFNTRASGDGNQVPFYWHRLVKDPTFMEQVKQRWAAYRQGNYSDERIMATVDSLANLLTSQGAADRNQQAWGIIGRQVWPNYFVGHSYQEELDYMKGWITDRLAFMDQYLLPKEPVYTEPLEVSDGWNGDVIAEKLPVSGSTTRAIDGSFRVFYAAALKASGGMPVDRMVISDALGTTYQLQPYNQNNSLTLDQNGQTATVTFASPFCTEGIYMLMTSGNGASRWSVVVNYTDGTSENAQTVDIRDWSVNAAYVDGTEAKWGLGNVVRTSGSFSSDNHYALFEAKVNTNAEKQVSSLTVKSNNNAIGSVFAFSRLVDEPTGIMTVNANASVRGGVVGIYSANGVQLDCPQQGLNIIRHADGTIRKVIIRR
ncbi:MAG: CotH kinase family protein [Prevotella sp.]|nr:CotH kinase family protein [Prevotella sp.]